MSNAASALDAMSEDAARAALSRCCGASRWVDAMLARRPFGTRDVLVRQARDVWSAMRRADVLEALEHHPPIGADLDALRTRFGSSERWAAAEQASVRSASEETLAKLRDGNRAYEDRFGHLFLVCATGKTAEEMLLLLRQRLNNDPERELAIAATEQMKITELRLDKISCPEILTEHGSRPSAHDTSHARPPGRRPMSAKSPITTHVLDTSYGRPARGVAVRLSKWDGNALVELAARETDEDGRVTDLIEPGSLERGIYRISFATSAYYEAAGYFCFYPTVDIEFRVDESDQHYHVPLLLSPFGYSTYRGS